MLQYLGLFDEVHVPSTAKTSADILQFLLETKLAMQPHDKDMIAMLHEIEYELNGSQKKIESSLVVKGEDSLRTAMAKTVGLPLGIAAKFILDGTIQLRGLHVPVSKEIYEPVLKELEKFEVKFKEIEK
jgi:saccharopine dehydrogenase (NADP+, L-glutamate forming)